MVSSEIGSFSEMLKQALGTRLSPDAVTFLDMLSDKSVMEFPYAPAGLPDRLVGAAAIAQHLEHLSKLIAFDRIGNPVVHETLDPNVIIAEFEAFGRGLCTGEAYEQRYISVIRTSNGRIIHYRDYWNPLAVIRTLRGPAFVETLNAGAEYHG